MHVLFNIETGGDLPDAISNMAIEATIDFVEVCCQHTAYITRRGNIDEHLGILDAGKCPLYTVQLCLFHGFNFHG
jgi:hypothetical protein